MLGTRLRREVLGLWLALVLAALAPAALAQEPEASSGEAFYPSARLDGIEDLLAQLVDSEAAAAHALDGLLEPANTNSPRDTILSFLRLTQRYYDLLVQDSYTAADTAELDHLYDEMEWFFDLRRVAPSLRSDRAVNGAVYLREVLDRIGLPPLDKIPNRKQMLASIKEGYPPSWQIGDTPLVITRIDEGPNAGKYLFSPETLVEVEELYWQLASFPYRTDAAQGFYQASFLTPRPTLQEWTDEFPQWMHHGVYGQTIWQWIALVLVFVLAGLSIWLLLTALGWLTRNATALTRSSALLMVPLYTVLLSLFLYDVITDKIFITGRVFQVSVYILALVALLAGILLIFSFGTVLIDLAKSMGGAGRRVINAQLITLGVRVLSIIAIIALVLQGMQLIGFSLTAIVAGAGVTGLAIALAAQNTLRNVFGSLMLLLDKPFSVGQRVKLNKYEGTVEEIGMRSTRLRLMSGHLVTIPNESVAGMDIENVDQRPSIRRNMTLPLPFDLPQDKIRRAKSILHEILSVAPPALSGEVPQAGSAPPQDPNAPINRPGHLPQVVFDDIAAGSLTLKVTYWYSPPDYPAYLKHRERINHEIIRRFRAEGIYKEAG
ncbi:mechanosensitive ion channel family protein [Paracoccus jeotgali]|uniref:mechanosensitive ion channel family protein n=1 Tax=Paracoccus jeotgali TaxID=2065379 RepID=UPI0028AB041D|nr:mechanosensitive ion channel family protein [Paracoccus jeotgali]